METKSGNSVTVSDYNYHYMSITGSVPSPKFQIKLGNATLSLFEVENWEHISVSDAVYEALQKLLSEEKINESKSQKE